METKVLIVAGGKGERLRPITETIAKPMVKVGDKSVLEHNLNLFKKYGFKNFILALCYLPKTISDYFGDGKKFGVEIEYTHEDPDVPLGTAGAISLAKNKIDSTFIVTYGDSLRVVDVRKMWEFHKEKKAFATICVYKRFDENPKSMVVFDKHSQIIKFKERPTPKEIKNNFVWSNAALYIFEPEIFNYIKKGDPSRKGGAEAEMIDFGRDVFPRLLEDKKRVFAFPMEGYFIDIGNKEKLDQANSDFKQGLISF